MARKRVPPEAQIIALFSGLPDETRKMVLFGLNAMMVSPSDPKPSVRSTPAPTAPKKSGRKGQQPALVPNSGTEKEDATSVSKSGERCGVCGNEEDYQDHFQPSPNYHEFEGKKANAA